MKKKQSMTKNGIPCTIEIRTNRAFLTCHHPKHGNFSGHGEWGERDGNSGVIVQTRINDKVVNAIITIPYADWKPFEDMDAQLWKAEKKIIRQQRIIAECKQAADPKKVKLTPSIFMSMFIIFIFAITGCNGGGGSSDSGDNNDPIPDLNGDDQQVEKLDYSPANPITDNPAVIKAVKAAWFPMNSGTNPPQIQGNYIGNCFTTSDEEHGSISKDLNYSFELSKQAKGRIDYIEVQPDTENISSGNYYVSGENNSFTVVSEAVHYFGDCKVTQAVLYSGTPEEMEALFFLNARVLHVTLSKENCDGHSIPNWSEGDSDFYHEKPEPDLETPDEDTTTIREGYEGHL